MKVVGIHRATMRADVGDGSTYWFAREVSIGHHLKLIAEDVPELHDQIVATWPAVEQYPASSTLRGVSPP
jgi:hypothetical protein